ncbi:MAG: hypothetical protein RR288_05275, partial [Oscillibacter sp.]
LHQKERLKLFHRDDHSFRKRGKPPAKRMAVILYQNSTLGNCLQALRGRRRNKAHTLNAV